MSNVIVGGNMASVVLDKPDAAAIQLCEDHHKDLQTQLGVNLDYHHQAFHILAVIAGKAMGSDNVVRFKCPVCAMQEFDWIKSVVEIVAANVKKPSLVVPS